MFQVNHYGGIRAVYGNKTMDIPKDQFSSGQRDIDCWAKVYGTTKEEAMTKARKYLSCYPPKGYNTNITWKGQLENGTYMVHLKRWHSCD